MDTNIEIDDELLNELADTTKEVSDKFDSSEDHALFILGVRLVDDDTDPENYRIQTHINANGYYGILAEGLYSELHDQVQNGNTALFAIIRDVIRDIEESFGIDTDEEIIGGEDDGTTIH